MARHNELAGNGAMHKDVAKLARAARKQGWKVERTSGNHFAFRDPQGRLVATISGTSGNKSTAVHLGRQLRKAGLK